MEVPLREGLYCVLTQPLVGVVSRSTLWGSLSPSGGVLGETGQTLRASRMFLAVVCSGPVSLQARGGPASRPPPKATTVQA